MDSAQTGSAGHVLGLPTFIAEMTNYFSSMQSTIVNSLFLITMLRQRHPYLDCWPGGTAATGVLVMGYREEFVHVWIAD